MLTNNKPSNIVIHYFGREGVSCQGKDSERERGQDVKMEGLTACQLKTFLTLKVLKRFYDQKVGGVRRSGL